ncbi:hypothetical protein ACHQM5_014501 [Ranunculus cassubicifolius]
MSILTETIPKDVITTIAARVGSSSLPDLLNLKQSCKTFYELGGDNFVFQNVSMEKLPAIPWILSQDASYFLRRCQETENPEALYRLGMVEYFSNTRLELGQAFLARAAYLGHIEASYILGIILICTDSQSRIQGIEHLNNVEIHRTNSQDPGFSERRQKSLTLLRNMWLNHFILLEQPICTNPNCKKIEQRHGWEEYWEFSCEACKYEHEVNAFCRMLRSGQGI